MSFWKVVEETRRKHPSQGKNSKNLCELQWYLGPGEEPPLGEYYARGTSWAGALGPEEEESGVHPRILEGAQDPSCLSVRWVLPHAGLGHTIL